MPSFQVHGSWLVELRDAGGRVLLTAAERGHGMWALSWIASVRAAALDLEPRFELRDRRGGGTYIVFKDHWDDVFATSPLFASARECHRVLFYLLRTIPTAPVYEFASRRQAPANGGIGPSAALPEVDHADVA